MPKKSMKPGGGGRFEKLTAELKAKGAKNPKALAAWIGRKKYKKKRFQKMAAVGRKRAALKRAAAKRGSPS